jgi:hypothetical protein
MAAYSGSRIGILPNSQSDGVPIEHRTTFPRLTRSGKKAGGASWVIQAQHECTVFAPVCKPRWQAMCKKLLIEGLFVAGASLRASR